MTPGQRKRPAPGASPSVTMHPIDHQFSGTDHLVRWNSPDASNGFAEDGSQALGSYGLPQVPTQFTPPMPATPSNILARRQANRALIPTGGRVGFDGSSDPWSSLVPADPAALDTPPAGMSEQDSLAQLEQQALKAKREAEAKRKQIPPFVQKLSSFLNEGKNQDLIRWSEKGDSFIVVDEEEFAKRLIPELFKHNNYASFVRQLNMYGFHKRVGLSDNSMRASERKNKSPSEYSNPYFRRGHPNLLWLITKPKNNSKAKKASSKTPEQEADSDDDVGIGADESQGYAGVPGGMSLSEPGGPKKELALFRDEFKKIRDHQQVILQRMQRLEQNQQRIEQQQRAQQQKDQRVDEIYRLFMRHENSLQNMMQILVYHFKKTLEDGKSAQQIKDIMASGFLPGGSLGSSHGVVELDDLNPPQPKSPGPGVTRRAPRLLEAPPSLGHPGTASTVAPSPATTNPDYSAPEMGSITEILESNPVDAGGSPRYQLSPDLDANQQENLLRLLHDANNNAAAANALTQMTTGGPSPTMPNMQPTTARPHPGPQAAHASHTPRMVQPREGASTGMMNNGAAGMSGHTQQPGGYAAASPAAFPPVTTAASSSMASGLSPMATTASPDMTQYSPAPPSIPRSVGDVPYSAKEYENLKRLQAAQDANIQLLGSKLAPLSPSGQMSGFGGPSPDGADYFQGGNFDLNDPTFNEFINSDPFGGEVGGAVGGDESHYDFSGILGMPGQQDGGSGMPGEGQDAAQGVEVGAGSPSPGSKRRRVQ